MPNESREHVCGDLKRAQPRRVIMDVSGRDDLVRFRLLDQRLQLSSYRFGRADRGTARPLQYRRLLPWAPETLHALDGWGELARATTDHVEELKLCGSGQTLRFRVRRGRENSGADYRVWLRESGGRLEILSIKRKRDVQILRREMGSEGKGQTKLRGEPGAEVTRA